MRFIDFCLVLAVDRNRHRKAKAMPFPGFLRHRSGSARIASGFALFGGGLQGANGDDSGVAERGATLWLAGLNPGVLDVVRCSGLAERLGQERLLFNDRIAIERYQTLAAGTQAVTANRV